MAARTFANLLAQYPDDVQALARRTRGLLLTLLPGLEPLVRSALRASRAKHA
jgi:hypothetical protein